ncbi:MAG TPA: D,D-heptose 1,7-bisphosphate phosphatase, partial [Sedimentisphaerales bacterium]|nr:D,D-heptose 1,7-bisphosphate phosphatase [Sedimentisphaerales bacterium]
MLRPAVFLDRDGTLVEDRGLLAQPSDVVFYPDTFEALRRLQERFVLFVVTHQPWVARGVVTLDQVDRVNAWILTCLAEEGVIVAEAYVCPHNREERC